MYVRRSPAVQFIVPGMCSAVEDSSEGTQDIGNLLMSLDLHQEDYYWKAESHCPFAWKMDP